MKTQSRTRPQSRRPPRVGGNRMGLADSRAGECAGTAHPARSQAHGDEPDAPGSNSRTGRLGRSSRAIPSQQIRLRNHGGGQAFRLAPLRAVAGFACAVLWPTEPVDVGFYFVSEMEIVRLNEQFVRHSGATDVITFSYGGDAGSVWAEVFICPTVAAVQARRFRVAFESELARYVIHGLLHLRGYNDRTATQRQRMKKREDALLKRALAAAGQLPV